MMTTLFPNLVFVLVSTSPAANSHAEAANDSPESNTALAAAITEYFKADMAKTRRKIAGEIRQIANNDPLAVAKALRNINLWNNDFEPTGRMTFPGTTGPVKVVYSVGSSYSSEKPSALLMRFVHQEDSIDPQHEHMANANPLSIVASLRVGTDLRNASSIATAITLLNKRFNIDRDRVYLVNSSNEAMAWHAATSRPDLFAGILGSGYPDNLPYPNQMFEILANNLKSMPIEFLSKAQGSRAPFEQAWQLELQRAGAKVEHQLASEEEGSGLSQVDAALKRLTSHRRPARPATLRRTFRFPECGDLGWIRTTEMRGELWHHQQLAIAASDTESEDDELHKRQGDFIRKVLYAHHGHIEANIENNVLEILADRCRRIEIDWPVNLVASMQPMGVFCNGKKRFSGVLKPDIPLMLLEASTTWDFYRPVAARTDFLIRED